MKRKIIYFVFVIVITFIKANSIFAIEDKSGTAAFPFLKIYSGLRAQSMGENYVAVDEGISTIYYNPAGIVGNKNLKLSLEHMIWTDILTKSNLSLITPSFLKLGTFGFGFDYINIPYEKRKIEDDHNYESAAVKSFLLHISHARSIKEKILLGLSLKIATQDFDISDEKYSGSHAFMLDLGSIYRISDKTNLGIAIKNIGSESAKGTKDTLPSLLRIGQASKLKDGKILLASDLEYGFVDKTTSIGVGCEYKLSEIVYPRIGYKYKITNDNLDILNGLNLGFGVNYKSINFDYAFTFKDDLATIHRIALEYNF